MTSKKHQQPKRNKENVQIMDVRSITFPQAHTGLMKTHRGKKVNTKHHYAVSWISSKNGRRKCRKCQYLICISYIDTFIKYNKPTTHHSAQY